MSSSPISGLKRSIAVLKISSERLLNDDEVGLNMAAVEECADHVAEVNEQYHPLLVHGSAVGEGKAYLEEMGVDYEEYDQQSLASYGSARVSVAIQSALAKRGMKSGQALTTVEKMKPGSTLMHGILYGIIQHENVYDMNENDLENVYELKLQQEEKTVREKDVGVENDRLSAEFTMALIEELKAEGLDQALAVHLAIFTKIGGMVVNGEVQSEISAGDREAAYKECNGTREHGSGGMRMKLQASFNAYDAGAKSVHMASPDQNWLNVINDSGEAGKVTKVVQ